MGDFVMANNSILRVICLCTVVFLLGVVVGACKPDRNAIEPNKSASEPNKDTEHIVPKDCQSKPSSSAILQIVRTFVFDKTQSLSEQEKTFIRKSSPAVGRYRVGIGLYEYSWAWQLPTGRVVRVSYTGNLASMSSDKVIVYLHDLRR